MLFRSVNPRDSGLAHAVSLLKGVEGVDVAAFEAADVVRHPMVERIVRAYDKDAARILERRAARDHDGPHDLLLRRRHHGEGSTVRIGHGSRSTARTY